MPEIARFFGIIVRMYVEADAPHHRPHLHAYHQEEAAVYAINPIERIAGFLSTRQERLVEAWIELHGAELVENWERLQKGQAPSKIEPLR